MVIGQTLKCLYENEGVKYMRFEEGTFCTERGFYCQVCKHRNDCNLSAYIKPLGLESKDILKRVCNMSKLNIKLSYKNACILKHALRDKINIIDDTKELEESKRALKAITDEINKYNIK